jgi:hypothetical protein
MQAAEYEGQDRWLFAPAPALARAVAVAAACDSDTLYPSRTRGSR